MFVFVKIHNENKENNCADMKLTNEESYVKRKKKYISIIMYYYIDVMSSREKLNNTIPMSIVIHSL